ncbi:N-formylglutamate amidohydrolase [Roseiconus lacunae]|uniref:N-formylglutamate amidohydrolase n=1 Tax=Roseiconus lacunae TaxID=2605694 RepID=UPI00309049F7|nr:N-formylglutamate amidohydrolase [Stieleria sp. HD01]
MSILITCESGGFRIPEWVASRDSAADCTAGGITGGGITAGGITAGVPDVHGPWCGIAFGEADLCGREAAIQLSSRLQVPCLLQPFSPALVDVTRPTESRRVFGARGRQLSGTQQARLLDECYHSYWRRVEAAVTQILEHFTFVVHLSVHSFVPHRKGRFLRTDVGLLYDSSREHESDLCADWIDEVYFEFGNLRVRRNYPTRGDRNALHGNLRQRFSSDQYVGIEVALNRWWAGRSSTRREEAIAALADCCAETLGLPSSLPS